MSPLSPAAISRAIHVVSTGGAVLALIFAYAIFDEYRVRRHHKQQAPLISGAPMAGGQAPAGAPARRRG